MEPNCCCHCWNNCNCRLAIKRRMFRLIVLSRRYVFFVLLFAALLCFTAKLWYNSEPPRRCEITAVDQCNDYEIPPGWNTYLTKQQILNFSRVLLVVHFNSPSTYAAINLVKPLYENIFADIVFCGPESSKVPLQEGVKFVSYSDHASNDPHFRFTVAQLAENFYACVEEALLATEFYTLVDGTDGDDDNSHQFDGVLAMSDDVILNFWQLKLDGFNTSSNWLMTPTWPDVFDIESGDFCDETGCFFYSEDYWMWPKIYQLSLLAAYRQLSADREWEDVLYRLTNLTYGSRKRLFGRTSADCFYITSRHLNKAISLFRLFNKYRVYMEIAVPTTLQIISRNLDELQFLNTSAHFWATDDPHRPSPVDVYRTDLQLIHPFKMASLFKGNIRRRENCFYCSLLQLTNAYATLQNNFE